MPPLPQEAPQGKSLSDPACHESFKIRRVNELWDEPAATTDGAQHLKPEGWCNGYGNFSEKDKFTQLLPQQTVASLVDPLVLRVDPPWHLWRKRAIWNHHPGRSYLTVLLDLFPSMSWQAKGAQSTTPWCFESASERKQGTIGKKKSHWLMNSKHHSGPL